MLRFTLAAAIGDGCIGIPPTRPNCFYLSFTHSAEQRDYLAYKLRRVNAELGTNGKPSQPREVLDPRTGKHYVSCQAMVTNSRLRELYHLLYPSGKKTYTSIALERIGMEGLAVFWMDDGCVVKSKFAKNRGLLATYCSEPESGLVCDWINGLTGVHPAPYEDRGLYRVRINASEMPRFLTAIRPYVHSSMKHKVTLAFTHYNTKSKREYESSLTIPFVDEDDKAARARNNCNAVDEIV